MATKAHANALSLLDSMLDSPEAAAPDTGTVQVSWDFLRALQAAIIDLEADANHAWAQFHASVED